VGMMTEQLGACRECAGFAGDLFEGHLNLRTGARAQMFDRHQCPM
jgi:hypothetical protein